MMQLFNNTKLCTQILCFMIVVLLPCFGMLMGVLYANFHLFESITLDSSLEILNRQISSQIKTFTFLSHQMIERYQLREKKRLESVNIIYQFIWNIDLNLINIEPCLNKKISKYSGKCYLCYGIMNQKANLSQTNFAKYLKIADLLSVTFLMGDNSFDILFAGTTQEKFMAVWPQQGVVSFDPQTRPWFKLEQSQSNSDEKYETHFTQPYIHAAFKSITVSHTQSLYDSDFSRIGVVTIQLNFSSTFPSFLHNNTKIKGYILDENFYILQSYGQSPQISKFFDQNATGFDKTSSDFLKAYLNKGEILQTCHGLSQQLLCLKDVYNQEFIVQGYILQEYNQIFILVFNPSFDLAVLEMRQNSLNNKLDSLIQTVLIYTIPPYVSLMMLTILITCLITTQISKITHQAEDVIFKNNADYFKILHIQVFDIENKVSLNCLEKLEIAFATLNYKMITNQKRNPQCQKMNEISHYLLKDQHIQIQLKRSIELLCNKDFCPPKRMVISLIKDSILRCLQKSQVIQ